MLTNQRRSRRRHVLYCINLKCFVETIFVLRRNPIMLHTKKGNKSGTPTFHGSRPIRKQNENYVPQKLGATGCIQYTANPRHLTCIRVGVRFQFVVGLLKTLRVYHYCRPRVDYILRCLPQM